MMEISRIARRTLRALRCDQIQRLNDRLRIRGIGGYLLITPGVMSLPVSQRTAMLAELRRKDLFEGCGMPFDEHDRGLLYVGDLIGLFAIDYYDTHLTGPSPDPTDTLATQRILTLMLAEEIEDKSTNELAR